MVHRLEEFPAKHVECCAGKDVIQYAGGILPLISVARALGLPETAADANIIQTIIYRHQENSIGLIIEGVEVIVKEAVELQTAGRRSGVLGSAIVGRRVTEFVDVSEIVRMYAPEFMQCSQ
jgi:two-component system chemotaxis sensor kinase CheA